MTDADALARLETLVQSQLREVESSDPWQPVTDYSFEARKAIEGPHAELIKSTFGPYEVLDVGCGYGHLVRMLRDIDVDAVGEDLHVRRPLPLALRGVIRGGDIASENVGPDARRYYLVVCREVLEHLTLVKLRRAVTNLCARAGKFVYVTTRFCPNPDHLLDVATGDALDPTHITMLNQDFLRTLFVLEGYKRRADLEATMDWKGLNRVLVYER